MPDFAFAPTETLVALGTPATKYAHNLAALRVLKEVEAAARHATRHEQEILARYTGWGDGALVRRAFPQGPQHSHTPPAAELRELLNAEEINALRASSLNAHYTSLPIIRAIYNGLQQLGLSPQRAGKEKWRVLEPAAGVGHFIGAMPSALREQCQWAAVELDPLSARITKLLYPSAHLYAEGFESAHFPPNWFDLVISNVPFGNYRVCDPTFREGYLRACIHDYFFAKAMRVTRPGGVIAFITSRYTLDKQDARLRAYLATHAELLAAVRLPHNAFTANAGTQVVTDVLILHKRPQPDPSAALQAVWREASDATILHEDGTPVKVTLNALMHNPDFVLGQPVIAQHGMYGRNQFTVNPDGRDLPELLAATLRQQLPADLWGAARVASSAPTRPAAQTNKRAVAALHDPLEQAAQQELAGGTAARTGFAQDRAAHALALYRAAKQVIQAQVESSSDEQLVAAQGELNRLYDRFRVRYGYLNSKPNHAAWRQDKALMAFLRALEEPASHGGLWRKTPFFSQRTIRPLRAANVADQLNPHEALLWCLNECGRVDLARIGALCRQSPEAVRENLRGFIFPAPDGTSGAEWLTKDEYLSGNIQAKLLTAEAAARLDASFQENVTALRAALPTPLSAGEITARLGAAWLPSTVITAFAHYLVPAYTSEVRYLAPTAQWVVEPPAPAAALSLAATQHWGTRRLHALELLDDALNLRRTVVYDLVDDNTRRVNQLETVAAQAKVQEIKEKFQVWVWQDEQREEELCRLYNEQFNNYRERRYDGSHLTFPGAAQSIELRPHQKDAVWRILQSRTTLIGHCVGAGKTLLAIAAAYELRRLGLARKSLIVVPKHVVGQWAAEAQRLYPGLRMLTTEAQDFTRQMRGETLSRIATGDWDLILVPQPSFKLLPVTPATSNSFIQAEIARLRDYIAELQEEGERRNKRSIKQLERTVKQFEAKLKIQNAALRRDDARTITFEELGIEALFVDEFHHYKNLYFSTKMTRIAGLSTSESQQAFDMFVKIQWLLGQGGRVVALTGTPVSNTLGEVWIMMRYLQLDLLQELGLDHFDAWAQAFAETTTGVEMKPDGSGFRLHTRFNKFVNLPELARLWRQCLDVRTAEQLDLPRPTLAGGGPVIVSVPASAELLEFVGNLAQRSEAVRRREVSPAEDNMLKITSEGRRAALDMRLVKPELTELPANKIDALVERIGTIYRRSAAQRGAQLVFCDLATPKGQGS